MRVLRRHSLAVKLPLGIALLLALACLALTLTAFLQVWRSAFEASSARLSSAARQVAALVEPGLRARVQTVQQVANDAAIRAHLTSRTPQSEAEALLALARYAQPTGRTDWRLIAPAGETLLATPGWTPQPGDVTPRSPASVGVGLLRKASGEDHLFYEITAAVLDDQQPVAYLIERRWIAERATSIDLLERLIGDDVRLAVGNASGDVWTDFTRPIDPLPATIVSRLETVTGSDRQPAVARGVAVAGTPWLAAVTVPRSSVLAPIRTYLTRALGITVGVLAVGIAAGWIFSRRITRPLRQLTESAENIAAGEFGERHGHPRGDEIDRLAASFAAMEARVEDARRKLAALVDELESRVKARTADLESANKELEAFSYSVSHDLRAPIRAISGFAAILVEDHGAELSKEARAYVDFIASRSHHMGNLIDDLLSFSLAARQPISQQPIDMSQLSNAVTGELTRAVPGRNVDVVIGSLPPARGEPALVRQVLANLLDNAFKFTAPRPTARIEVGSKAIDGESAYFVRDNGVGFDMRYADRLFGVFQRLHSENEFEGTGVGLAIVQRIVQRHDGRVWADAAVDQGATFYFTLPQA